MDWKRLILVVLQRLSPIYVATALWWLTDYVAIMIGGVALSLALAVAWPFVHPLLAVLYEEVLQQRSQAQAQRRTQRLTALCQFLNAYKRVAAKYPPALLTVSAPAISAQLELLAEALRQSNRRRQKRVDEPCTSQAEDAYALVHTTAFSATDMPDWSLRECETWANTLCTALTQRNHAALQQAVQHFVAQHARPVWAACLATAEHDFDREATSTLAQWSCLHKAQDNVDIRQNLTTLLQLDPINRQAHLKPYLTRKPLACAPEEVRQVMAYIRYDPVAAGALRLLEQPRLASRLVSSQSLGT